MGQTEHRHFYLQIIFSDFHWRNKIIAGEVHRYQYTVRERKLRTVPDEGNSVYHHKEEGEHDVQKAIQVVRVAGSPESVKQKCMRKRALFVKISFFFMETIQMTRDRVFNVSFKYCCFDPWAHNFKRIEKICKQI